MPIQIITTAIGRITRIYLVFPGTLGMVSNVCQVICLLNNNALLAFLKNNRCTDTSFDNKTSVGNNSFVLAAFDVNHGGYLVYTIILGTPGMKLYNVIVDPGNGQILATQEISPKELEKMHLKRSSEVVRTGGNLSGFAFSLLH